MITFFDEHDETRRWSFIGLYPPSNMLQCLSTSLDPSKLGEESTFEEITHIGGNCRWAFDDDFPNL